MSGAIQVRTPQTIEDREIEGLTDVLIDCVEGGASVSFMLPIPREKAAAYWHSIAASVARGERKVLVAEGAEGVMLGTVQVVLDQPENQPHLGEFYTRLMYCRAPGAQARVGVR